MKAMNCQCISVHDHGRGKMKLKEISLSIYFEPCVYGIYKSNYNSEKAYLCDCRDFFHKNIFPIKKQFCMETRNIVSFFSRLHYENYNDIQYPFSKLIISCCKDERNSGKIINCNGITEIRVLYDYSKFNELSIIQKKCDALSIIMDGLSKAINNFSSDLTPYRNIESTIISHNYINIWIWNSKWNKNRKYKASVYVNHNVFNTVIGLIISDNKGTQIHNKELVTTKPDEWDYYPLLGKLLWHDDEVVLLDKKGETVGKWSANKLDLSICN